MYEGILVYLFDSTQVFQESWEFNAPSSEEAMKRLHRIGQARLGLLSSCVRLVQLKGIKGQSLERVLWKGHGGDFAWPQFELLLRRDDRTTQRSFRGVPKEIFGNATGLTLKGKAAFASLNKVLAECQCVATRQGKQEPIGQLQPTQLNQLGGKANKKATKKKLFELVGPEEGQRIWDAEKAKINELKARIEQARPAVPPVG